MNWRNGLLAALAALSCWIAPATARNVSDHWYAPSESGWGLSVTQQEGIAFIVLFAYGNAGAPMWYVAQAQRYGQDMEGNPGFSGPLYRMSGPWLGGPFDPSKVTSAPVGNLTFESNGVNSANYRDCSPTFVPAFTYDDGLIDIEHDGSAFRMWFEGKKQACMYTGAYTQHGASAV